MKKAKAGKKSTSKTKAGKLDLRTKAGRAWKAKQAEAVRRAKNREADKLAAKAAVTGSWVDLKDHRAEKLKALATTYGMGADRLQRLIEEDRAEEVRNLVAAADTPPSKVLTNVPTDMEKLKASGMYWELFPNGQEGRFAGGRAASAPNAYSRVGV